MNEYCPYLERYVKVTLWKMQKWRVSHCLTSSRLQSYNMKEYDTMIKHYGESDGMKLLCGCSLFPGTYNLLHSIRLSHFPSSLGGWKLSKNVR